MPKLTHQIPRYRRHKASGQAVVTLNGRDVYLGPHGATASKAEYDRVIAEWMASGRQQPSLDGPDLTLAVTEVIAAYWRHAATYYRKNGQPTDEQYGIRAAMRPLKKLYGRTPVSEFGPLALKTVRQAMIQSGHSRKYINDNINRIKRMFKWAVAEELVPSTVYHALQSLDGLRFGRSAAREPRPVSPAADEHIQAIRPFASRQVWAMIELQRLTGMRPGEVTTMRACDIEVDGDVSLYRPRAHKTQHHGHERLVELGPRAQEIVRTFLKPDATAYLFSPADAERERSMLRRIHAKAPRRKGRGRGTGRRRAPRDRYSVDSYRRAITRACDCADEKARSELDELHDAERIVPHWSPHQLRHNFATMVRKQFGIEAARILLGHRSVAVSELYAEVDRAKVREVVARIG